MISPIWRMSALRLPSKADVGSSASNSTATVCTGHPCVPTGAGMVRLLVREGIGQGAPPHP
jgi:hypothetical protein